MVANETDTGESGAGGALGQLDRVVGGPARRRVVLLLAAVLGLQSADSGAIGSLAAPIESAFHIGDAGLGLLVTASTLAGAVGSLPFGVAADRVTRVRLLVAAVVVWGLATIVSAVSVDYAMLLASRIALGLLVAAAGPFVVSLAGDLFPADERSRLFGFVLTGELIGAGFGIVLAGTLSSFLGWRPALAVLALPAFAVAVGLHRHLPEPVRGGQSLLEVGAEEIPTADDVVPGTPGPVPDVQPDQGPSLVEAGAEAMDVQPPEGLRPPPEGPAGLLTVTRFILEVRTNVVLIVASGLGYFFLQGLETFAQLFLRDRYGVSQAVASLLFVVVAAGALGGVLLSGRLTDGLIHRGRPDARPLVAGVAFVATTVLFVPGLLVVALGVSIPFFVLAAAGIGAVNPPLDAARLDVMPAPMWGRAEAVRTALRTLLMGTAPVLFGLVAEAAGGGGAGISTGINTHATTASSRAGDGLAVSFAVFTVPLLMAGVLLLFSRTRYLQDVVATVRARRASGHRRISG